MRVTLTQVAQRAGVSLASASRALNGESASPRTVENVRRAARELAYLPDARAQSLKLGSTRQLAFAVADVGNPVYVEMMRAVEETVREEGYRVLISSTGSAEAGEIELLHGLGRGYADGLILSPLRITDALLAELVRLPLAVVVVGLLPASTQVDNVRANSAAGVRLAVEHLVSLGHRRLGLVNGPLDTTPGRVRGAAFASACHDAGLPTGAAPAVVADDFTFEAGIKAARQLLKRHPSLDAVVAANDLLATGAYHAAFDLGRDVPADLAVVGMDDSALASQLHPTLTSVSLGSAERGRRAAELLLARLRDPGRKATRVVVQPRLAVRQSTAVTSNRGRR
ncbi:MAG TPA: LacI family DNA-binding transcriptional regulator [Propionibacteriaceae bacterium]|nr:LacI family DNA-binding transcriptional regulator [Propionibacteriaceae bacterium]